MDHSGITHLLSYSVTMRELDNVTQRMTIMRHVFHNCRLSSANDIILIEVYFILQTKLSQNQAGP